jgi:hypothetical protein
MDGEQPPQGGADVALGVGEARLFGVGRVRQQQTDTGAVGQGADVGQVGEPAVHRGEVELEITRVQDDPLGRVEGGGEPVGDGVGDGDELHLEGTDRPRSPSLTSTNVARSTSPASSTRLRASPRVRAEP